MGGATFFPLGHCIDVDDCCANAPREQSFEFNLGGQSKLGMKLVAEQDHLVVRSIMPGIVQDWNAANPTKQLAPGSMIAAVNGAQGDPSELLGVIRSVQGSVNLRVKTQSRVGNRDSLFVPPKAGT